MVCTFIGTLIITSKHKFVNKSKLKKKTDYIHYDTPYCSI